MKLLGGAYLVYVALKHFVFSDQPEVPARQTEQRQSRAFWAAVIAIEFTDVAFAADSILASIALVGPIPPNSSTQIHPKLWLIILGGLLGVILMRMAASAFIKLLRRFPRFETTAYLLVGTVGVKLIADWWYDATRNRLDFQSPSSPAFWVFWSLMTLWIALGFIPQRKPVL